MNTLCSLQWQQRSAAIGRHGHCRRVSRALMELYSCIHLCVEQMRQKNVTNATLLLLTAIRHRCIGFTRNQYVIVWHWIRCNVAHLPRSPFDCENCIGKFYSFCWLWRYRGHTHKRPRQIYIYISFTAKPNDNTHTHTHMRQVFYNFSNVWPHRFTSTPIFFYLPFVVKVSYAWSSSATGRSAHLSYNYFLIFVIRKAICTRNLPIESLLDWIAACEFVCERPSARSHHVKTITRRDWMRHEANYFNGRQLH